VYAYNSIYSYYGYPSYSSYGGYDKSTCDGCLYACAETNGQICACMEGKCEEQCATDYGKDTIEEYLKGGGDSDCCAENGCDANVGELSDDCREGCVEDCYGDDDLGGRWSKDQCLCLLIACLDDRDCDRDDEGLIEDFVGTGCGAESDPDAYSYDYRDLEDMADEYWDGAVAHGGAGLLAAAVAAAVGCQY